MISTRMKLKNEVEGKKKTPRPGSDDSDYVIRTPVNRVSPSIGNFKR